MGCGTSKNIEVVPMGMKNQESEDLSEGDDNIQLNQSNIVARNGKKKTFINRRSKDNFFEFLDNHFSAQEPAVSSFLIYRTPFCIS